MPSKTYSDGSSRAAEARLPVLLPDLADGKSIVLVLGKGGVGKTTVAAALSMIQASRGRSVLAVTVDPSNRLKDSLGLSGEPGLVEEVGLDSMDLPTVPGGSLHALILDAKTEMDRLVAALVKSSADRRRIQDNVFYRKAAGVMAGTHEYMAMMRLLDAAESGRYDLIVLDTPPERHAMDFLDAPRRLEKLLSNDIFDLFVKASSGMSRMGLAALRWKSVILKGISRFAGEETFLALLDFVLSFRPMFEVLRAKSERARLWLGGERCATVVVCRPETGCAGEVEDTVAALVERGLAPAAVVANRTVAWPPWGTGPGRGVVDAAVIKDAVRSEPALQMHGKPFLDRLASDTLLLARLYKDLADRDHANLLSLSRAVPGVPLFRIPLLAGEVKDLVGLGTLAGILCDRATTFHMDTVG